MSANQNQVTPQHPSQKTLFVTVVKKKGIQPMFMSVKKFGPIHPSIRTNDLRQKTCGDLSNHPTPCFTSKKLRVFWETLRMLLPVLFQRTLDIAGIHLNLLVFKLKFQVFNFNGSELSAGRGGQSQLPQPETKQFGNLKYGMVGQLEKLKFIHFRGSVLRYILYVMVRGFISVANKTLVMSNDIRTSWSM